MAEERERRVPTAEVNKVLADLIERNAPPQRPGEEVKLLYASQIATAPPTLAIVSNRPDEVPESYQRYLSHGFREAWPFTGSPLATQVYQARLATLMLPALLSVLASYLVGAIPTSYLVSRYGAGIDLRQHGSGNLGATNLYRVLGWKYAVPVALFDIAKGAVPVLLFAPQVSRSQLFALALWSGGHPGSRFLRLRSLQGREGRGDGRGCHAGADAARPGSGSGGVGDPGSAYRVCLARQHRGRGRAPGCSLPARSPDDAGAALDRCAGCRWRNLSPPSQHSAAPQGDRKPFWPPRDEHTARMTIAVLGAGSWGTTLANLLAAKGQEVRIWAYESEVVEGINRHHENALFLPGVPLASTLQAWETRERRLKGPT